MVRSVEVVSEDQRVRFSWIEEHDPHSIFEPEFWQQLCPKVDQTVEQRGLMALPDFEIEGHGFAARCCRLLCVASENGVENIMVRFQKFVGNARKLFADACSIGHFSPEDSARLAAVTLETIYLPLRNLTHYLDELLNEAEQDWPEGFKTALSQFKTRMTDFQFDEDMTKLLFSQQMTMTRPETDHPEIGKQEKRNNVFQHLVRAKRDLVLNS